MNEELRKYLNELFEDAPKTRATYELKEELIANSNDRYFDLVESGVPEDEALHIVIESIGDIDQLFDSVEPKEKPRVNEQDLKRKALFKTIAIGLYIFGFILLLAIEEFTRRDTLGFIVFLIMAAIATCILVYDATAYPTYKKQEDTVVEDFKEWNHNKRKNNEIRSSVHTIIWMSTLVIYFVVSFLTMAWYITWVIFLIGVCARAIADLMLQTSRNEY
ncbi:MULTISPECIES: permease prefix domain 1-containing protein [unclassified Breznakia]|uniref:permease prefix domain 1-containing protein n=1 Tax=unclassified Breznakia TaxID=2623764 RepID=UPI00240600F4|nr:MULTISPECIES: permease prefix domain 1-containing protein [unclassified Breznakia]MDF9838582.1 hypothetical protein [Breznakia sp. PFB2-8]MDF9860605.1 hypothetical protein [Breznakia sp. PH5-24]